jgi:uncharacterized LabA/DUF88 family protein
MRKIACQRLAVLIDADNIEIGARKGFNRPVNYDALFAAINGREVVRALYFKPRECSPGRRAFLERKLGIEVKLPPKNVDTWLTIDAVTLAEKVDTIALIGGDADYVPLVWYLKSRGCKVEVWCWPGTTAEALRLAADEFRALDERVLLPVAESVQNCAGHETERIDDQRVQISSQ